MRGAIIKARGEGCQINGPGTVAAPDDTTIAFVRWAVAQLELEATEQPKGDDGSRESPLGQLSASGGSVLQRPGPNWPRRNKSRPDRPKPPNNLIWGILATIFCCQVLGIVSIVYAIQVDRKWKAGDYIGAEESSRTARIWALLAAVIGLLLLVVCFIVNIFYLNPEGASIF